MALIKEFTRLGFGTTFQIGNGSYWKLEELFLFGFTFLFSFPQNLWLSVRETFALITWEKHRKRATVRLDTLGWETVVQDPLCINTCHQDGNKDQRKVTVWFKLTKILFLVVSFLFFKWNRSREYWQYKTRIGCRRGGGGFSFRN